MRKQLGIFLGLSLAAVLPASAASGLRLHCITRDLTPGAHVWMEVRPEYHQIATQGMQDSGVLQEAKGESIWQFDVPASGKAAPIPHDFAFPADLDRTSLDRTSSDQVGVILLKTRFRIDHPAGQEKVGYGEVYEMTLSMPSPPGTASLSRCLRLREVGDRMIVETAADCRDASFTKSSHMRLPPPPR